LFRATQARFQREDALSLDLAEQALGLLSEDGRGLQAGAKYTIGVAHLRLGNIAAAGKAFTEAVRLGEAKGGLYMSMIAFQELSELQIKQGQLSQAIQTCQRALSMADRWSWQAMPAAGLTHVYLGRVLYERNDLAGAADALSTGVDLLLSSIEQFILAQGFAALAQIQYARGDLDDSFATIQRGEDWFAQMNVADTGAGVLLALGKVRFWIEQGNLSAAANWFRNCRWLPEDTDLGYLQAVTLVRLRLAQNRGESQGPLILEAVEVINRLLAQAETKEWWGLVIELSLLHAMVCEAQSDTAGMLKSLERAITLGEPEGYIRSFVDQGELMRLLLLDYQSNLRRRPGDGVNSESTRFLTYIEKLLAAFSGQPPIETTEPESLLEPLTEREQEILRLLSEGFSNREIADRLVVAVSTVKSHINSLYGKLGTHRRTQAVAIARDSGLI
jgi:LuxR family maltose regulon positive regulatory protein